MLYTLNTALQRRRRCFAWFLLLAFCLQRIIGAVSSEWTFSVEIEQEMDQVEQAIADKIKMETDFQVQVDIKDERQLAFLQSQGYTAPFIFSEEIDGRTWYYTVDQDTRQVLTYRYTETDKKDPLQLPAGDRSFVDGLFSKFFFWELELSIRKHTAFNTPGNTIPHFPGDHLISVPSPPPKAVCYFS